MSMTEEEVRRRIAGPGPGPAGRDPQATGRGGGPGPAGAAQISETDIRSILDFDAEPQERRGLLPGPLNLLVQGAFFGAGDELLGGLRGIISPSMTMAEGIEAARATEAEFREEHPAVAIGLEIVGGAATGMAGAARVGFLRAARPLTRALVGGAVGGGVAGAATAEGGLPERAAGAAVGATVGAVAGPVIMGAASGAGSILSRIGARIGIGPGPAAAGAREATERALSADEVSIQAAREAAERAGELGVPTTLMEIGEENVRALAGSVARVPGGGMRRLQGAITRRAEGQNRRVLDRVQRVLGVESRDIVEDNADMIAARAAAAQPAYDAAYAVGEVADDEVNRLIRTTPLFRQAYERARALARLDDISIPALFNDEGAMIGTPTVMGLDLMKQGLDDLIEAGAAGARTIGRQEARRLRGRLAGLLDIVDNQVPEYRAARAAFSGSSTLIDALEQGSETFLREDPRRVAQIVSEMAPDALEQYRIGALDAIRARIAGRGDQLNALRAVFNDELMRDRIAAIAPDAQDFAQFVEALDIERRIIGTQATVLGNSLTAARQVADNSFVTETVAGALTSRNPVASAVNVGIRAVARRLQGTSPNFADEIAAIMSAGIDDPADLQRVLSLMETAFSRTQGAAAAGVAAGGGAAAASATGRALRIPEEDQNPITAALPR